MADIATDLAIAEEDVLRARLYDLLGSLLSGPPDRRTLTQLSNLSGDKTDLGGAIASLARLARHTRTESAEREFNALFVGLGRGELLPYGSYYLTGFLNEKPLAALRRDMAARGITRVPTVFEPEDNIASLCEMMSGMILGRFGTHVPVEEQRDFFNTHIGPWAGHFFTDLEGAQGSVFYAPVGAVGRVFVGIEKEAFRLTG